MSDNKVKTEPGVSDGAAIVKNELMTPKEVETLREKWKEGNREVTKIK